jgi:tetratricopeptide (TPR) repeat protein
MPTPETVLPDPSPASLRALDQATVLAAAGEPARARALALPLLGEAVLHPRVLVLLADLARRLGDTAEAARLAQRAARMAPKSARAQALCAMALTDAGRHGEALAKAERARGLDPDDPMAKAALLLAAGRLGRPQRARDAALAILAASADNPAELLPLAASVLDSLAGGRAWGIVFEEDGDIAGLIRTIGPQPAAADLLVDGNPLAQATADRPVCPQAGLYGFRVSLPPAQGPETAVEAILAGEARPLFGSPLVLSPPLAGPAPGPVRGAVRLTADGRIAGSLFDPAEPSRKRRVALFADGEDAPRLTVEAAAFDPALLEKGLGDGAYAFVADWPHDPDVACRKVHVRDAATGQPLAGSPLYVPQPAAAGPALARLVAWLRQASQTPDAPPPLPETSRGALLEFARRELGATVARLDAQAQAAEPSGEAHA